MGILDSIFGNFQQSDKVKEMLQDGSSIIDVRTVGEFQGGHVAGSVNYPLQDLEKYMGKIKKLDKAPVLCCASGNRSGQAARFLKSKGIDCINGGSWRSVNSLV